MLNFWMGPAIRFTLSILSWCSRDLAAQTGDVFGVRAIVPVITEDLALWSFLLRLTHDSFKNSTPVSAAGLVDPRGSQFSSWCVPVCPQTDIADIEHCFGKEEEGVSFLRNSCWIFECGGHLFYFVDFILMFTRPAADTGEVFGVHTIVPLLRKIWFWAFLPRFKHDSFKNSTTLSAAGLLDPRDSHFSSSCVAVLFEGTLVCMKCTWSMFRRCLIDTFEIVVLGVRCGRFSFSWALILVLLTCLKCWNSIFQ